LPETDVDSPSLAVLKRHYGFVPRIFRAQMARPDVVESEAKLLETLLFQNGALTRIQKEFILLVVSATNQNSYFPAVHTKTLEFLGVKSQQSTDVTIDHQRSNLSEADKTLLDFARKLTAQPTDISATDVALLHEAGFTDRQILEAVLMIGTTNLLNTVQLGLGVEPDFKPRITSPKKEVNLATESERPMLERPLIDESVYDDPDLAVVRRVKDGDTDAFEELVRRHGRRVYRSLIGILGDPTEAEDALQDCFLKAFQHLAEFEGRARFSTWLVRIAINTGAQRLRSRKDFDSLDEEGEDFRPKRIQVWDEDPESCYSREELRKLVESEVMKLPVKYRVALILRDLEELSTTEAANALGLTVPGLKARVLRGRLMLRESMVGYFAKTSAGVKA
ncbi:MAG TPA: peroxidase-related enzyme, partial [Pyrinomonadaceae bacterium]|nr:peroxidase-related enzyme [Pyrinomonadaceae bacterium]